MHGRMTKLSYHEKAYLTYLWSKRESSSFHYYSFRVAAYLYHDLFGQLHDCPGIPDGYVENAGWTIFVVGISLTLGLSADMVPHVYGNVHPWIQPIFSSSLSLGAVSALVLNLMMRIGVKKVVTIQLSNTKPDIDYILEFMEKQGQSWGAINEVVNKAAYAIIEAMESIWDNQHSKTPVELKVSFDEFKLSANLICRGEPIHMNAIKSLDQIMDKDLIDPDLLTGYMIHIYADHLKQTEKQHRVNITLRFKH